jgi:Ca2+-binding RTX toxin-like protein
VRSASSSRLLERTSSHGTAGPDVICGRGSDDSIFGGRGEDVLRGGTGGDLLSPSLAVDTVIGGRAHDLVWYDENASIVVNLTTKRAIGAGFDRLFNIEGAVGGPLADRLIGDRENNVLRDSGGDDILRGRAGDDGLRGGKNADHLFGGPGDDLLHGQGGQDVCHQGAGTGERISCP